MSETVRSDHRPAPSTPSTTPAPAPSDEDLLVALLNTTPTDEGTHHDELAPDDQAHAWLNQHVPDAPANTDLVLLRATRNALQDVVRGQADPQTLAAALSEVRLRPEVTHAGIAWRPETPDEAAVAARAVLAWGRVQADLPGRLRPCANTECSLFFIDRSRPNTGRWCSMAVCGNRMKSRRHYARSKAEQ